MSCCVQEGVVIVDRGQSQGVMLCPGGVVIVDRGQSQRVMLCPGGPGGSRQPRSR